MTSSQSKAFLAILTKQEKIENQAAENVRPDMEIANLHWGRSEMIECIKKLMKAVKRSGRKKLDAKTIEQIFKSRNLI